MCYQRNISNIVAPIWDPGNSVVKNPPANAGDAGSTSGSGRSPGEGNDSQFQYFCLENLMDKGTSWVIVHGSQKSQTLFSD